MINLRRILRFGIVFSIVSFTSARAEDRSLFLDSLKANQDAVATALFAHGRFGHPTQNRAISLREAARFQSFPDYYEFTTDDKITTRETARHIGNAVPVLLGRAIGKSLKRHLRQQDVLGARQNEL